LDNQSHNLPFSAAEQAKTMLEIAQVSFELEGRSTEFKSPFNGGEERAASKGFR
jgi:hypothetical protein